MRKFAWKATRRNRALALPMTAVLAGGLVLQGCGGGNRSPFGGSTSPTTPPTTPPTAGTGIVRGRVLAPNGTTPITGATVSTSDGQARTAKSFSASATISTTTDSDGRFVLNNVPVGTRTINIVKGEFSKSFQITVSANATAEAPAEATTLPSTGAGAPRMAVVTGSFDRMQDVLAKLGYGGLNSFGQLQLGTEKFSLFDGDDSLEEGTKYQPLSALFSSGAAMANFDIIFVNCGADEGLLENPQTVSNIRSFVNGGGKLYTTDYAYDFVEQAFPAAIDFAGGAGVAANQPEPNSEAEVLGGDEIQGTVVEPNLKAALQGRTPPAINSSGGLTIEGSYTGINAVASSTTVYVVGNVEAGDFRRAASGEAHNHNHRRKSSGFSAQAVASKPLTVTFKSGTGAVLYTTYHTAEGASTAIRPQEQILAALVFELGN